MAAKALLALPGSELTLIVLSGKSQPVLHVVRRRFSCEYIPGDLIGVKKRMAISRYHQRTDVNRITDGTLPRSNFRCG